MQQCLIIESHQYILENEYDHVNHRIIMHISYSSNRIWFWCHMILCMTFVVLLLCKLWVGLQQASKYLDVWFNWSFSYIYSSLGLFMERPKTQFKMMTRRCNYSPFFCHSSLSARSLIAFQNDHIVTLQNVSLSNRMLM